MAQGKKIGKHRDSDNHTTQTVLISSAFASATPPVTTGLSPRYGMQRIGLNLFTKKIQFFRQ